MKAKVSAFKLPDSLQADLNSGQKPCNLAKGADEAQKQGIIAEGGCLQHSADQKEPKGNMKERPQELFNFFGLSHEGRLLFKNDYCCNSFAGVAFLKLKRKRSVCSAKIKSRKGRY